MHFGRLNLSDSDNYARLGPEWPVLGNVKEVEELETKDLVLKSGTVEYSPTIDTEGRVSGFFIRGAGRGDCAFRFVLTEAK